MLRGLDWIGSDDCYVQNFDGLFFSETVQDCSLFSLVFTDGAYCIVVPITSHRHVTLHFGFSAMKDVAHYIAAFYFSLLTIDYEQLSTLCPKKICDYIFYNNFNNRCPITIIFGIVSSKSMRHQKMVSFPTSPLTYLVQLPYLGKSQNTKK